MAEDFEAELGSEGAEGLPVSPAEIGRLGVSAELCAAVVSRGLAGPPQAKPIEDRPTVIASVAWEVQRT